MPQPPDAQEFDLYLAKVVRFTNFLSHDICQTLETLVLVLEKALQRSGVDNHARLVESLADITALLDRIDELIQHYFSLTRLVELYSEPVELGAVVEAFALEMRQQFADRGIKLHLAKRP
jgi:signal transduction histidine kinase